MRISRKLLVLLVSGGILFLESGCDLGGEDPPSCPEAPDAFGLFSESIAGVRLDTDAFLGLSSGGGGSFVPNASAGFVDDDSEKVEGRISKRSTINVGASGEWAIWFIQNGLTSDDSDTKDMCAYSQGSLRFWVKSPVNLLLGIRSGDVRAGDETSKVLLSSYPSFQPDNEWHEVSIPLRDFEGGSSKADLTQIKVFFVIGASSDETGSTNGSVTFWVDNVRWEK